MNLDLPQAPMNTKPEITPTSAGELDDLDPIAQVELAKYLDEPIDALAAGIKASRTEIAQAKGRIAAARDHARESAISAGFRFIAAKTRLGYGPLGEFIKGSGVSWDTANLWMRLSSNYERARNLPSGTSLRKAYVLLEIKKPRGGEEINAKIFLRKIKCFRDALKDLSKKVTPQDRPALAEAVLLMVKDGQQVAAKLAVKPRYRALPLPKFRPPTEIELAPEVQEDLALLDLAGFFGN